MKFVDTVDIETLKLLEEITLYVKDIVENVFVGVLQAWWYAYCCYYEENSLVAHMSFFLEQKWKEYYEDEEIHKAYLKLLGVYDWRNITSHEDCFYNIPEFRKKDMQYNGRLNSVFDFTHGLQVIDVETISGEEVSFIIERARNKIGEDILDDVQNKLSKVNIPECDEDKYLLYYRLREQSFNIKREEDMRCWEDADVVIEDNTKSIECSHAYAMMHKNIIITLLSEIC